MHKTLTSFFFLALASPAFAINIGLAGSFPGKAILIIEGSPPKAYNVGATISPGVRILSADSNTATIDVNGKRQILTIGQFIQKSTSSSNGGKITLQANSLGHFVADAQINGASIQMLVDTGASYIALPASEALRLKIDFRKGKQGHAATANGVVNVYLVKLDTIKIGDVELFQVDAMVQESGLPFALLGMSFLNRMNMNREGEQMILTKRF